MTHRMRQSAKLELESLDTTSFDLDVELFAPPTQDTTSATFAPLHYEPKYAYPLLVWLHGPGRDDEQQLLRIMPAISMRNYVAVAPRGFPGAETSLTEAQLDWPQTPGHIEETERRVFGCIEAACHKFNIAENRIFLAGFDRGGTMAFRLAMNHPERFAGVLSLCGPFPAGHTPFGRLNQARQLPLAMSVGRDSEQFSPPMACENLRLLHTAGMTIALRQYPCGHQLAPDMLRDVDRWIMEQMSAETSIEA